MSITPPLRPQPMLWPEDERDRKRAPARHCL